MYIQLIDENDANRVRLIKNAISSHLLTIQNNSLMIENLISIFRHAPIIEYPSEFILFCIMETITIMDQPDITRTNIQMALVMFQTGTDKQKEEATKFFERVLNSHFDNNKTVVQKQVERVVSELDTTLVKLKDYNDIDKVYEALTAIFSRYAHTLHLEKLNYDIKSLIKDE